MIYNAAAPNCFLIYSKYIRNTENQLVITMCFFMDMKSTKKKSLKIEHEFLVVKTSPEFFGHPVELLGTRNFIFRILWYLVLEPTLGQKSQLQVPQLLQNTRYNFLKLFMTKKSGVISGAT